MVPVRCITMIPRRHLAPLALIAVAAAGGCGGAAGSNAAKGMLPSDFVSWAPERDAFQPVRLRVHPLTRVTREASGDEILLCHLELRDRFDQVVKCLGLAQVELFPADAQGKPKDETIEPERLWQVDLRDPKKNSDTFDGVVTHTYALHLGSLPPLLAKLADSSKDAAAGPFYALRVRFLFKDAAGQARQLEAIAGLTPF